MCKYVQSNGSNPGGESMPVPSRSGVVGVRMIDEASNVCFAVTMVRQGRKTPWRR